MAIKNQTNLVVLAESVAIAVLVATVVIVALVVITEALVRKNANMANKVRSVVKVNNVSMVEGKAVVLSTNAMTDQNVTITNVVINPNNVAISKKVLTNTAKELLLLNVHRLHRNRNLSVRKLRDSLKSYSLN